MPFWQTLLPHSAELEQLAPVPSPQRPATHGSPPQQSPAVEQLPPAVVQQAPAEQPPPQQGEALEQATPLARQQLRWAHVTPLPAQQSALEPQPSPRLPQQLPVSHEPVQQSPADPQAWPGSRHGSQPPSMQTPALAGKPFTSTVQSELVLQGSGPMQKPL